MKKFFRNHPETILIGLAVFFLAIVIGFYFWGISRIVVTMNQALNYVPPQGNVGYDLAGAMKLDLHGLLK